jgi:hypothetical protein
MKNREKRKKSDTPPKGSISYLFVYLHKFCMAQERLAKRRLPSIEKSIADIQPESDVRVRLTGTVIDITPNSIVIDDGTGKVDVYFGEEPSVRQGQYVRVITRILPMIDGFECRGEAIQDLTGFDLKLYKKAREIVKNF